MKIMDSLKWLCGEDNSSKFDLGEEHFFEHAKNQVITEETQSIILKEEAFSASNIKEYPHPSKQKKFLYRPEYLDQYIGQSKAKALVKLNLKKIKELKHVHFFISGNRGCGKTTLAYIIRNHLGAHLIERIGKQIASNDDIVNIVNEINSFPEDKQVILFIDEIHSLKPELCEIFYSIMEQFTICNKNIKPFILIGATTEKHKLLKSNAPMIDRFQVKIELENYNVDDIELILTQVKDQLYKDRELPKDNIKIIAKNCKFTPRIAISLLEDNLIELNIKKILEYHRIVKDGLTDTDYNILRVLYENKKPIGAKALSNLIGINEKDYLQDYEPFLTRKELIIPTSRGRTLGVKGEKLITEV